MRNFLIPAVLALAAPAAPALAQSEPGENAVHVAVGQQGRGYEKRGEEIAQRLGQRGHEVWIDNYEGSDAISLALCGDRATVGIMQIDAIYAREQEGCDLKTVGSYGDEYAFILFPPDSRMDELSDLDEDSRILVDTIGSGTELFWRTIVSIETGDHGNGSDWASAKPVHDLTLLARTLAEQGAIDAMLMVGVAGNEEVIGLLQDGWELGELYDKDINDMEFRGKSLYARETVEMEVPGHFFDEKNDAYVVPSYIVIGGGLQSADRKLYGDIVAASQ
ncbi:TAXI family TRAP transporter solute-binding subunit [Mangrovicoccus ximenensis]|uniref:hypothetical protein n=1 Tax=Mangrovicoccus ximenensis TaxID=1911570 RepID=UPI000D3358E1|nr:hypothetical protein [Mangrovicoccus ximenensis]